MIRRILHVFGLWLICFASLRAELIATYEFQNTFAANDPSDPALVPVNPSTSSFISDNVFGQSRIVYRFEDNQGTPTQSGLTLDTSGLLPSDNNIYSVEMVFKFDEDDTWRRIFGTRHINVENPNPDVGFYANNQKQMSVDGGTGPQPNPGLMSGGAYHHLVISVNNLDINGYRNGGADNDANVGNGNPNRVNISSPALQISTTDQMYFFLDNIVGGGQNEFSFGNIAYLNVYNHALTQSEAQTSFDNFLAPAAVPEPSTLALSAIGLGIGVFYRVRRRKSAKAE